MKYLKTYKLFESNSTQVVFNSENDWNLVNDSTKEIIIYYSCDKLPELPKSLQILKVTNNKLIELPKLHEGLIELFCYDNKLEELPELPKSLTSLNCGDNLIKKLPKLPEGLLDLYCFNNHLTELPELPNSLNFLNCNDNLIKILPTFPKNLNYTISQNPLERLPNNITKEILNNQRRLWIKENAYKWIMKKHSDYNLLKEYLSEDEINKIEKEYTEIISQDQFGMFGLKNKE